jgi:hypothetical protein
MDVLDKLVVVVDGVVVLVSMFLERNIHRWHIDTIRFDIHRHVDDETAIVVLVWVAWYIPYIDKVTMWMPSVVLILHRELPERRQRLVVLLRRFLLFLLVLAVLDDK